MTEKIVKRRSASGTPIKKPVPLIVTEEGEPVNAQVLLDNFDKQAAEDMEKLEEFQGTFGGQQYYVRVERYNEKENEMEIVDKIFFDNFDPYILGKKYGGGRFVCTLLNQRGKYVEGGRFHFNFAKQINPEVTAPPPDPMQNPAIALLLKNMETQQAMLVEVLKTSLTGEKQTPIDQLVAALKGLHDMNPTKAPENPMKNLKELLELQALLKDSSADGDDEPKSTIMTDVKEALKILADSKNMIAPKPPANPPGVRPFPIISKPPLKEEIPMAKDLLIEKIMQQLPMFEEAAKENADPERWARLLIEILEAQIVPLIIKKYWGVVDEDEVWEKLIAAAETEEKVNKIYEVSPTLAEYKPWVASVLQAAIRQFDEEVPAGDNGVQPAEG